MSTSDIIALLQLILSLIVGLLAVLGYFRLIKTADADAKERKKTLIEVGERQLKTVNDITEKENRSIRQRMIGLSILAIAVVILISAHLRVDASVKREREGIRKAMEDVQNFVLNIAFRCTSKQNEHQKVKQNEQ